MHPAAVMLEPGKGPFFVPPPPPFQILADQFELFQPGEQIMHTKLQIAPLGSSNLSTALLLNRCCWWSFTNYVHKKRWVGSPKMSTFIR